MNARDMLEAARFVVYRKHPYISACLMSLRLVEMQGIGTLAVDAGWRLYYDPEVCERWGMKLLPGVVAHECWHVMRRHHQRMQDRDPQLWNIANDIEINSDIRNAGWKLPPGCVYPETFDMPKGLLAEEYYEKVVKNAKKVVISVGGVGGGKCGSCAGNAHDFEEENKTDGQPENDKPAPFNAWEQEVILRQTAQDIAQASKSRGDVPAGLCEWAQRELAPPTIDWRKQLASLVRRSLSEAAGAVDHTWKRYSRRSAGSRSVVGRLAPILPALHQPVPRVAVILDVSGSMEGGPSEAARAEIMGIVRGVGCTLDVFVADVRIAGKARVASANDVKALGETLGGTDMAEAVREVDRMRRHDVIVVLTDGETEWHHAEEVRSRVLAAITPGGRNAPEWLRSVRIGK